METLGTVFTHSPLHSLLLEALTRYLSGYGAHVSLVGAGMAEADLCNPLLPVTNITRERLRVGIWSGNIVLSDLELRQVTAAHATA